MTSKEDTNRSSLEHLASMKRASPPAVADSDLVVMAINRLQRAVTKMQAFEYDEALSEHLSRAGEMLGWVAQNMWDRQQEATADHEDGAR